MCMLLYVVIKTTSGDEIMNYRIIGDSCTDLTSEMKAEQRIEIVPLTLTVKDVDYIDDETFEQKAFLEAVAASDEAPKSSCPSPEAYKRAFGENDETAYCVTLSANLSGSYNSAVLGQKMLEEDYPNKKVHVFNSRSASIGQTLIALKIQEYADAGNTFEDVVKKVEAFIEHQETMFVLDNLETLRKNGRLSTMKAKLVNILNIRPVMTATPEGTIEQAITVRGNKKALKKMCEEIGNRVSDFENRILGISHCNCKERALFVKAEIERLYAFKKIIIAETAGVATMYANDGGIVISF